MDCVDQWDDGDFRYIVGFTECAEALGYAPGDPGECADLDEDGYAGYPDGG